MNTRYIAGARCGGSIQRQTAGTGGTRTRPPFHDGLLLRPWCRAWMPVAVLLVLSLAGGRAVALIQEKPGSSEPDTKKADLGERLVRKAVTGADEDLMSTIIRTMGEVSRQLEINFNAGAETQAVQASIVEKLDEAIRMAAAQRRSSRQRQREASEGDRRRRPKGGSEMTDRSSSSPASEADAEPNGAGAPVADGTGASQGESALRRSWGHLPARDRDEIIQGLQEGFLERYREWIERYYRALQEAEE